jgi:hypothetical protein
VIRQRKSLREQVAYGSRVGLSVSDGLQLMFFVLAGAREKHGLELTLVNDSALLLAVVLPTGTDGGVSAKAPLTWGTHDVPGSAIRP